MPGLGVGGAEVALVDLLKSTANAVRHTVLSFQADGPIRARLEALGIPVLHASMTDVLRFGVSGSHAPDDFELVHAHLHRASFVTAMAHAVSRLPQPFVFSIHQMPVLELAHAGTAALVLLNSLSARLARAAIFVSERSRQAHVRLGYPAGKTVWVPNGYDLQKLQFDEAGRARVRKEVGLTDDEFVIGHLARVTPEKDHATLFEAFQRVRAENPHAKLLLAGAGTDRLVLPEPLRPHVLRLGLRPDNVAVMSACDMGVLSSATSEAFPNVLAEFQALGRVCVTTDLGDSARIVGSFGRVVPPRRPDAIAAAILGVMAMAGADRQRAGQDARAHVSASFSISRSAHAHLELWSKAIA